MHEHCSIIHNMIRYKYTNADFAKKQQSSFAPSTYKLCWLWSLRTQKNVKSISKKLKQTAVMYQLCDLSKLFLTFVLSIYKCFFRFDTQCSSNTDCTTSTTPYCGTSTSGSVGTCIKCQKNTDGSGGTGTGTTQVLIQHKISQNHLIL